MITIKLTPGINTKVSKLNRKKEVNKIKRPTPLVYVYFCENYHHRSPLYLAASFAIERQGNEHFLKSQNEYFKQNNIAHTFFLEIE